MGGAVAYSLYMYKSSMENFPAPEDTQDIPEAEPEVEPDATAAEQSQALTVSDVPDCLFASDNEYDIPVLDINMQADYLDLPLVTWGSVKRRAKMPGTWCFYADDYRFSALWSDPTPVVNSGAIAAVEPNFSVNNQMPRALALYNTYRKRWLARYWQSQGLRIWVDLHTGPRHAQENLLGVPVGWKSYMTRGYADNLDWLDHDYEIAVQHAGTEDVNFVVFAGSNAVQEKCRENGWIWCASLMDTKFNGHV